MLHPPVDVPMFRTVWLLRNLSLDVKLFLRNVKNVAFDQYLDVVGVGEPGKRHARRAHKAQVVSDWLNPNSLGSCQHSVT